MINTAFIVVQKERVQTPESKDHYLCISTPIDVLWSTDKEEALPLFAETALLYKLVLDLKQKIQSVLAPRYDYTIEQIELK